VSPKTFEVSVVDTAAAAAPSATVSEPLPPLPAPPVAASAVRKGAGNGVVVVLMVAPDGRVGDIYWDQLPAMTDEQLLQIEATIRQRHYPSNLDVAGPRRITETLDVRAMLKLLPTPGHTDPK
jgi:hypothetical protein